MSKLTSFKTNILYGTLNVFPNRVKRLVLISSLNSIISNGVFEEAIAKNLNEIMGLVSTRELTPMLPLSLSRLIWSKVDHVTYVDRQELVDTDLSSALHKALNIQQSRVIANQVIRGMPECLRYSSNNKMREDILQLFKSRTDHSSLAVA